VNGPLMIGIAGGTGAGKSTIARRLAEPLPKDAISCIEHDAYYRDRPELSAEARAALNYDHPDSLDGPLFFQHLQSLKAGKAIEKPEYDFVTHRRAAETVRVEPRPVVIVEGILLFVDASIRDLLDICIYVDTDPDIRVFRRIRRDMESRGRTFESIRKQYYETVRPMHLEFVEPSKRYADLIIPEGNGGNLEIALEVISERMRSAMT
jgi:uridine kinase